MLLLRAIRAIVDKDKPPIPGIGTNADLRRAPGKDSVPNLDIIREKVVGAPSMQVNFLAMLEVVLSPVWVWLVVNEQPAKATLIGGAIILAAISFQALSAGGEAESSDANPDLPR